MNEEGATYLVVTVTGGDVMAIVLGDEGRIDAAVDKWMRESVDELLCLTRVTGARQRVKASNVIDWEETSPEFRRRGLEWEKALSEEEKNVRVELGLPWQDE